MSKYKSKLHQMSLTTQTEFWNDSCKNDEMLFAIEHGAVGGTSNPVIVLDVLKKDLEKYKPIVDKIILDNPTDTEDEIVWKIIEYMSIESAILLEPIYLDNIGKKGYMSIQTNPKYYRNFYKLVEQAEYFNTLGKNIMVKIPATKQGILAMEECVYKGISINATVLFTVSQSIEVAEAVERAFKRRELENLRNDKISAVCTIMVGRIDDYLREVAEKENICVDPECYDVAGVNAFKCAYKIYKDKKYKTRLLVAAFRNHYHWSAFIGGDVSLTIPGKWIKRFAYSDVTVENRINIDVEQKLVNSLINNFKDYVKIIDPNALNINEFDSFALTKKTLLQFLNSYDDMIKLVRNFMLN